MSTLAHVFEAAGLSTIVLASMKEVAERIAPPRTLYCEFPLGRPLGHPSDPDFQTDVITRGLALLDATEPIFETHPEVIESDETPMACAIPPRFDPNLHPAVDEAQGIRAAYDRALAKHGNSGVGRVLQPDDIPGALGNFAQIADGTSLDDSGLPTQNTIALVHDIRTYYEEAGLELVTGPTPGGRAAEAWFYEATEAGKTILAAKASLKEQGASHNTWFYMSPAHR